MPRTALTPVVSDRTATVVLPALLALDNANGNNFANNGRVILVIKNNAGAPGTFTVEIPAVNAPDGSVLTNSGRQYTIAAGVQVVCGPFPPLIYNQSDGTVWVDSSAATMLYQLITVN